MAHQSIWYLTNLPKKVVEIIDEDLINNFDDQMSSSKIERQDVNKNVRNSENVWIDSNHWIAGFIWHYVQKANNNNFLYDLTHIDGSSLQYTKYSKGQFYNWHNDQYHSNFYSPVHTEINAKLSTTDENYNKERNVINNECVRKLSFSLQLSDPDDYEGGNVQLLDENNKSYIAPRNRGAIILFDSRTQHRVLKVTKGVRRSIVGWVVGPRWK